MGELKIEWIVVGYVELFSDEWSCGVVVIGMTANDRSHRGASSLGEDILACEKVISASANIVDNDNILGRRLRN